MAEKMDKWPTSCRDSGRAVVLRHAPKVRLGSTGAVGKPHARTSACCRCPLESGCSGFGQHLPFGRLA